MDSCARCDAALPETAQWCGQCFAPRATIDSGSRGGSIMTAVARPVSAPAALPPTVVRSRWRKTTTTFGPVGRVIATICLIVPFVIMLVGGLIGDVFALGGAAVWLFVIMPWGLRDVWKAGQVGSG